MTQPTKAQFFAQYYGQKVYTEECLPNMSMELISQNVGFEEVHSVECYLKLRDLKDMTTTEAKEIAMLFKQDCHSEYGIEEICVKTNETTKKGLFITYIEFTAKAKLHHTGHGEFLKYEIRITNHGSISVHLGKGLSLVNNAYLIYQILISNGFALPFIEYSIEQLIEMNWIKIVNKHIVTL